MAKAKREKPEEEIKEKKTKAKTKVGDAVSKFFDPSLMIDDIQDAAEKKYGLSSTTLTREDERLSTGSLSIDMILDGGIVGGGWYTIYGGEQSCKSTLTMQLLAMIVNEVVRKQRRIAASIFDYEGSSDQEYIGSMMQTLGLKGNPSTLFGLRDDVTGDYIIKPTIRYYSHDVGEDFFRYLSKIKRALPNVEKHGKDWYYLYEHTKQNKSMLAGFYDTKYLTKANLLRVPAPDGFMQAIAVCDSYPAMLPEGLDDDDRNDAMAEQARMFSTGIKKIRGGMRKKRMTVIGVNQTRQRPATMFGCLHGSTKVPFVDGSVHTMQEIVEQKLTGQVWSFNEETNSIEARDIIDHHYNGDVEDKSHWMKIVTQCPETGNGQAFVICTPNHEILTDNGWKRADEVKYTDRLVSKYTTVRNGTVGEFLNGIASGDSSIVADSPNSGLLKLQDNQNSEYVQWKIDLLEPFFDFTEYNASHNGECYIARGSDFVAYASHVPNREMWKLNFSDLSFAVLYMDDGNLKTGRKTLSISFKRFKNDVASLNLLVAKFNEAGFSVSCQFNVGVLNFDIDNSEIFFERIRKYIPDCMQYKLPDEHKGYYEPFRLRGEETVRPVYVNIIRIEEGSDRAFRSKGKYDISVEHNHNYMVGNSANGIIVHNSPEYEPCGEALRFYSDVRLKTTSRSSIPFGGFKLDKGIMEEQSIDVDTGHDIYRFIAIKSVKNKLGGIPNREVWARLWVSDAHGQARGFDPVFDTWFYLKELGLVKGTMANLKFHPSTPLADAKKVTWLDFKRLVLGDKKEITELCTKLGLKKAGSIRNWAKKHCSDGTGPKLYKDRIVNQVKDEMGTGGEDDE
ncbi:MAG: hypothetical protein ACRC6V_03925 [Bacteroidales bacterium]